MVLDRQELPSLLVSWVVPHPVVFRLLRLRSLLERVPETRRRGPDPHGALEVAGTSYVPFSSTTFSVLVDSGRSFYPILTGLLSVRGHDSPTTHTKGFLSPSSAVE